MQDEGTYIKKLISMIAVFGLVTSQIGCAGKVTKISAPLDQLKFDSNYFYMLKTNQNLDLKDVPGNQIQNYPDRIHITQNNETKYLMHSQIQSIDGECNQKAGTYIFEGMAIGAISGGVPLALYSSLPCEGCEGHESASFKVETVYGFILGALIGGLFGSGIGALIPKHDKIQITPMVSPTAQGGLDAGLNVGVKF
jgi:hypothetical protein